MKFDDCRKVYACEICGAPAEAHEIITRKTGGPCEEWNQIRFCRVHHRLIHSLGRYSFALAYPQFRDKIEAACERMGRVFDKGGK
jgi:hypothetical protein